MELKENFECRNGSQSVCLLVLIATRLAVGNQL